LKEDLVQEGRIGVELARATHDPAKGEFTTHAYFGALGKISNYLVTIYHIVKNKRDDRFTIIVDPLPEYFEEAWASPRQEEIVDIPEFIINEMLETVQPRWRQAVTDHLGLNGEKKTFKSIGDEMGISKARVEQGFKASITKMRPIAERYRAQGYF
jgi:DNA-directed RNA polymerase specialized sigma subunit